MLIDYVSWLTQESLCLYLQKKWSKTKHSNAIKCSRLMLEDIGWWHQCTGGFIKKLSVVIYDLLLQITISLMDSRYTFQQKEPWSAAGLICVPLAPLVGFLGCHLSIPYLSLSWHSLATALALLFLQGCLCLSGLIRLILWYVVSHWKPSPCCILWNLVFRGTFEVNWLMTPLKCYSREQSPSQNFPNSHFQLFAIKTHRCTLLHAIKYPPACLLHFKACLAEEKSHPYM